MINQNSQRYGQLQQPERAYPQGAYPATNANFNVPFGFENGAKEMPNMVKLPSMTGEEFPIPIRANSITIGPSFMDVLRQAIRDAQGGPRPQESRQQAVPTQPYYTGQQYTGYMQPQQQGAYQQFYQGVATQMNPAYTGVTQQPLSSPYPYSIQPQMFQGHYGGWQRPMAPQYTGGMQQQQPPVGYQYPPQAGYPGQYQGGYYGGATATQAYSTPQYGNTRGGQPPAPAPAPTPPSQPLNRDAASIQAEKEKISAQAKNIFNKFDFDKNGHLEYVEVYGALLEITARLGIQTPLSEKETVGLLQRFDANADGRLTFPEFQQLLKDHFGIV